MMFHALWDVAGTRRAAGQLSSSVLFLVFFILRFFASSLCICFAVKTVVNLPADPIHGTPSKWLSRGFERSCFATTSPTTKVSSIWRRGRITILWAEMGFARTRCTIPAHTISYNFTALGNDP